MKYYNLVFDEERALYGIDSSSIEKCKFSGPADGESALKECNNFKVSDCFFNLRYPLWHVDKAELSNNEMTENCRAAMWYDNDLKIKNSIINGIKEVRECRGVELIDCQISSVEFGWMSHDLKINNCSLISEYPFLFSRDIEIDNLKMKGKYSFQYVNNMVIRNSVLDTKDAFWHSKDVTVYDSIVKGEYLGWYSENLHFVRCKIIGTQPLCYCKNLIMEQCEMEDTDLSFENSEVKAEIIGDILSVKNPRDGFIKADDIKEVILDEHRDENAECEIIRKNK